MPIHDISTSSNKSPLGTHISTPANDCPKSREGCRYCGKKGLRSSNTKARNVLGPTNNHRRNAKNKRRKNGRSRTLNRSAIRVGSLVFQSQTADTERKVIFGNVPSSKQNTDENKKFRKEFESSHKGSPRNEANEQPEITNSSASEEG